MCETPHLHLIPARERQRIEIGNRGTQDQSVGIFACCDLKRGRFGLAADYEIAGAIEEFRQVRSGLAKKTDPYSAPARLLGPLTFMLVINQRSQHQREIAVHRPIVSGVYYFVTGSRKDGSQITDMNAGDVLSNAAKMHAQTSCKGITGETRAVTTGYRVLVNKPAFAP